MDDDREEKAEKDLKELTPAVVLEVKRKRRFFKANEQPPLALALLFGFQVSLDLFYYFCIFNEVYISFPELTDVAEVRRGSGMWLHCSGITSSALKVRGLSGKISFSYIDHLWTHLYAFFQDMQR